MCDCKLLKDGQSCTDLVNEVNAETGEHKFKHSRDGKLREMGLGELCDELIMLGDVLIVSSMFAEKYYKNSVSIVQCVE